MPITKSDYEGNQENYFYEIVICENNQNQNLETFISIKINAEYNEITPAIAHSIDFMDILRL